MGKKNPIINIISFHNGGLCVISAAVTKCKKKRESGPLGYASRSLRRGTPL